jgi:hypothetical protein
LDLDVSRPEPEELDPIKEIEKDLRRDSQKAGNPQPRRKEVSNRINCCMTEVPRQKQRSKRRSTKQFYKNMYFISVGWRKSINGEVKNKNSVDKAVNRLQYYNKLFNERFSYRPLLKAEE